LPLFLLLSYCAISKFLFLPLKNMMLARKGMIQV
jgi:hypothetical protein